MPEFWEEAFKQKQEMWGFDPALSATIAKDLFVEQQIKKVLIPGIGYGRNAKVFHDQEMKVTGIEISETAIKLANEHFNNRIPIFHASVLDMPFNNEMYEGIFCYALIHLLSKEERLKLISDCYHQLSHGGYMIFTAITKSAESYGTGTEISKDRFEMFGGVKMFFYDPETILEEFGNCGLIGIIEVNENYPFYLIKCKKAAV